jgi:hypothetical protein
MHDASRPPIGRASVFKQARQVKANVVFDGDDEFARRVEGKYRRGFLNAVSVGLDFVDEDGKPLDWRSMTPRQIRDEAFYNLADCPP